MLHYIRDAQPFVRNGHGSYEFGIWEAAIGFYHFLRVLGWDLIYEGNGLGDSYGGMDYVVDTNMEVDDVASWTVVGTASLIKDTTTKHQGKQSLKIMSLASGDGVQSSAWSAWGTGANPVYVIVWAANDSGDSWDVQVDNGGGSFASIGSIPDNVGVWTKYTFSYLRNVTANNYLKILDNNDTQGFIHIDDVHAHRSYWEQSAYETGTDGDVVNGNEFESSGYTFVGGDVGNYLAVYDPTNLGNSGLWKITSINGSNAVLDLRVGGAETLINTTSQDLAWRLVDIPVVSAVTMTEYHYAFEGSRVMLESPHTSKWRFTMRPYTGSHSGTKYLINYFTPSDGEYGIYGTPSNYAEGSASGYISMPGSTLSRTHHLYAMVPGDGSFFAMGTRVEETVGYMYAYGVAGYVSDDPDYDERERFVVLHSLSGGSEAGEFTNTGFGFNGYCAKQGSTILTRATVGLLVCDTGSPISDADSKANPFSTNEWVMPLTVCRDWENEAGSYGEYEADTENAMFYTRDNMADWSTFDSNGYFHLCNGIVWKWPGVSV